MVLDELAGYLADQSLGTLGTNLFLGRLPAAPDAAIALRQSGGLPPLESFNSRVEAPRVQVLIRETSYAACRFWAERLFQSFENIANTPLSGVQYLKCESDTSPAFLEQDNNGRYIFVLNLEVWKEF